MENVTPVEPTHPQKKSSKGCKIALIILGVLFIIVIVVGYLICTNVHKLGGFALGSVEEDILKRLPEGYDKAEVEEAFSVAKAAFENKNADTGEAMLRMQAAVQAYQEAVKDDELTTEELDQILVKVREIPASPAER